MSEKETIYSSKTDFYDGKKSINMSNSTNYLSSYKEDIVIAKNIIKDIMEGNYKTAYNLFESDNPEKIRSICRIRSKGESIISLIIKTENLPLISVSLNSGIPITRFVNSILVRKDPKMLEIFFQNLRSINSHILKEKDLNTIVDMVMKNGSDDFKSVVLREVILENRMDLVEMILNTENNINLNKSYSDRLFPLELAYLAENRKIAELLINKGANPKPLYKRKIFGNSLKEWLKETPEQKMNRMEKKLEEKIKNTKKELETKNVIGEDISIYMRKKNLFILREKLIKIKKDKGKFEEAKGLLEKNIEFFEYYDKFLKTENGRLISESPCYGSGSEEQNLDNLAKAREEVNKLNKKINIDVQTH